MVKLKWSKRAKTDLRSIYKWYSLQAGKRVADRIIGELRHSARLLINHNQLGYLENMLEGFPQGFRCLVEVPNYKIIYWFEDDFIKIATVFDTRQRPEKLYEIISTEPTWLCEPQVPYGKGDYPFAPTEEGLKRIVEEAIEDDKNGLFVDGKTFMKEMHIRMDAAIAKEKGASLL